MKVQFYINGKVFETTESYITGQDLKILAGLPIDSELYLSMARPYHDELIDNTNTLDLTRLEQAYFYIPQIFEITINELKHQWHKPYIFTEELRKVANVDPEHEVYIQLASQESTLATNDLRIDLTEPDIEHFFSKKKQSEFTVIVNGRSKQWKAEKITFDETVALAFGRIEQSQTRAYTITYSRGSEAKPEGIMVRGNEIRVRDKMIFNVTATDKS